MSENIEDKESTTDNEPIEEEPLEEVDESLIEEKNEDDLSIEKTVVEKEVDIDKNRQKSIIKKDWKFPSVDLFILFSYGISIQNLTAFPAGQVYFI